MIDVLVFLCVCIRSRYHGITKTIIITMIVSCTENIYFFFVFDGRLCLFDDYV